MISSDEEEACSELEEMSAELERFHSDEEDSCPMLDELANDVLETAKELDDSATLLEDSNCEDDETTELEESSSELEDSGSLLDEATAELETHSDEDDSYAMLDELKAIEELDTSEELETAEELDNSDELEDSADDDEVTVMVTLKVTYSLSADSVMSERVMFISRPFQKMNWLNSVTFLEPGNGSEAAAYLLVSGQASSISTCMWSPSLLIVLLDQTEAS